MNVTPIGQRVLLKPKQMKEEKTKGGIILPMTGENNQHEGIVVATGELKDIHLKKGDKVLFDPMGEKEVSIDGEKHIILDVKYIIAKVD